MRRGELAKLVAKQTNLDDTTVKEVIDATFELMIMTLAAEELVVINGFGTFRPGSRVAPEHFDTYKGPVGRIERKTVRFKPTPSLKYRLNEDRPRPVRGKRHSGRPRPSTQVLHQWLWDNADDRNRIMIRHTDIGDHFGVSRVVILNMMGVLREQGRIHHVGTKATKRYIYEVADPKRYERSEPSTHVGRTTQPAWG